jgi:glutaconyl-CoA/methylmalonyl-CoA decarboxylase subunit delta
MYSNYFASSLTGNNISDWVIVAGGVAIVFTVSVLIYLFIKFVIPSISGALNIAGTGKKKVISSHPAKFRKQEGDVAAIAMVLYLHFSEMHDEESNIITIKRVSRTYSPWSSKLYSMKNRNW